MHRGMQVAEHGAIRSENCAEALVGKEPPPCVWLPMDASLCVFGGRSTGYFSLVEVAVSRVSKQADVCIDRWLFVIAVIAV